MIGGRRQARSASSNPAAVWLPRGAALWRLAYVVAILLATVSAIELPVAMGELESRVRRALSPSPTGRDVVDAARNVVMFAGWGVVWVITATRGRGRVLLAQATATGLALSALVEGVQLLSPARTSSVLDLLSNAAGALAGALAAAAVWWALRAARGRRSFAGVPLFLFAGCYATAALLEAFSPIFRQTRHPGAWGTPLRRFRIVLEHLELGTFTDLPLLDLLLFAPAGFLAVLALVELGQRRREAAIAVALAGAVASPLAELARGFVGYVLSPGAVFVHAAGIAVGAAIGWFAVPAIARATRGSPRQRALLAGYAILLLLWSGRPFTPETSIDAIVEKLTADRLVPLLAYRERFDLHSAADALIPALLFLPLGVLLAARPLRTSGAWRGIAPAVACACALELLQIGIAGRTFDVTDILIPVAALGTGWILARRAGYAAGGSGSGRMTSSFSR